MEISNRAFGIFCVAAIVVMVAVRAQSYEKKPAPAAPIMVAEKVQPPKVHHGIPDSTLPPDTVPPASNADPAVDADDVAQPPVAPAQTPAATTPPATETTAPQDQQDDPNDITYEDDVNAIADNTAPVPEWQISDRDMLRVMLAGLDPQQRNQFRVMWFTMGPDERQDFLDRMHGNQ